MASAGHDNKRFFFPDTAYANREFPVIPCNRCQSIGLVGAIEHVLHRNIHDSGYRHPMFNIGNIDGKFTVTGDELFCAIERINKKIAIPALPFLPADVRGFLRENGNVGRGFRQTIDNDPMCCKICASQRRAVIFRLYAEIFITIHSKYLRPSFTGEIGHQIEVFTHIP